MHTLSYAVKKQKNKESILMVYIRSNCCSGGIGYYSITKTGFKFLKSLEIGKKEKLVGDEVRDIVEKELSKWKNGIEAMAELSCLILKKKNCWGVD